MPAEYLPFEKPVVELEQSVEALRRHVSERHLSCGEELERLEERVEALRRHLEMRLSPWEKVQLARHPMRPQPPDFCRMIFTDFVELHGDRRLGEDAAVMGGFAHLEGQPVMVIATRKGRELREYMATHFGCPQPEGYRKALRLMRLADKARKPIVLLVDTPGAYPGIGSEERHVGEAIACCLRESFRLEVPVISVITGEGGSGGALALAVGNRVWMFSNAYYSAITPEGCAAILWRSAERAPDAASALKLTSQDLLKLRMVDGVIEEPLGGAHRDPAAAAASLKECLLKECKALLKKSGSRLKRERYQRFREMGVFLEK